MCMSKCYRLPFHDLTLRFVLAKLVLFHIQFKVSSIFSLLNSISCGINF